jgi:hypothetical protein
VIENNKALAVEAEQSTLGADREITVRRLCDGLHRLVRQAVLCPPQSSRIPGCEVEWSRFQRWQRNDENCRQQDRIPDLALRVAVQKIPKCRPMHLVKRRFPILHIHRPVFRRWQK